MRWIRNLLERLAGPDVQATPRPLLDPLAVKAPLHVAFDQAHAEAALATLRAAAPSDVANLGAKESLLFLPPQRDRRDHGLRLLRQHPEIAWLMAFDPDGYLRQAALQRLNRPPAAAFEFLAVAIRLNDWVPQVRQAAQAAADRLLTTAPPEAAASAAHYLLQRRYSWSRWTGEAAVLDAALARPGVIERLADDLETMTSGPGRAVLQAILRFPAVDAHLPALAANARMPAVRALALETLVFGRARWSVGYGWKWIDKAYGLRRRVVLTEERPLDACDVDALIRAAVRDRFALVRKVAVDGLYARRADMPDAADIARSLLNDRSGAVRDRADFLLRNP